MSNDGWSIPPHDKECGSFWLNLFAPSQAFLQQSMPGFQNLQDQTNVLCDPTIEDCGTGVQMHRYKEYEEYNRFLGQMSGFLALTPVFVFIYPTWLSRTEA